MNQQQTSAAESDTAAAKTPSRQRRKLPFGEKLLAIVGLTVVVAWIVRWTQEGVSSSFGWFVCLSFLGSLAVAGFVIAKLFGAVSLHPKVEKLVLPICSLVPVLGYLIEMLSKNFWEFLAVSGSVALAYISATAYWRKHIPDVIANPAGRAEGDESGDDDEQAKDVAPASRQGEKEREKETEEA